MITTRFLGIALSVVLITGGCDGPSNFERTNPKDPESGAFTPRAASTLVATPKQNGTVLLRWPDASRYADGHLIEKSLGKENSFELLTTVSGGNTTYRDTTREFDRPTYYRHRPFVEKNGERKFSASEETKLEFGTINSLQIETDSDGTFHLSWTDSSALEQLFRVEVSIDGSPFHTVETLNRNVESYTYRPSSLSFADTTRTYRVTAPLLGDEASSPSAVSKDVAVRKRFAPKNMSVTFRDEETTQVRWQTRAYFAERLLLTRAEDSASTVVDSTATTLSPETETYTLDQVLDTGFGYRYAVSAVDAEGHRSASTSEGGAFFIDPPELNISSEESRDAVDLSWSHPSPGRVSGFRLVRSTVGKDEKRSISLEAETRAYRDVDVDTAEGYRYRIRTMASEPDSKRAGYLKTYERDYTVDDACEMSAEDVRMSHLSHRGVAMRPGGSHVAIPWDSLTALVDTRTGEVTDCFAGHDGKIVSVAFGQDGALLGGGSSGLRSRESEAVIWDVDTGEIVQHFDDVAAFTVDFGPEGDRFGVTGGQGEVHVWRASDWEKLWSKPGYSASISPRYLAFSSNGETLATVDYQNRVQLRDTYSGEKQKQFSYGLQAETGLHYAQGQLVVSGDAAYTTVADPENGSTLFPVPGTRATVSTSENRIGVSLDLYMTGGFGVWSARTGEPLGVMRNIPRIYALALAPNGNVFTATSEGLIRWRTVDSRWKTVPQ